MRNGSHQDPLQVNHSKAAEMAAYAALPPEIREVIRNAPFDVSCADMLANSAVMDALKTNGANWLRDQLWQTYRRKILSSS